MRSEGEDRHAKEGLARLEALVEALAKDLGGLGEMGALMARWVVDR